MVGWVSSDLRFTVALLPLYEGVRFQLLYSVKKKTLLFFKKNFSNIWQFRPNALPLHSLSKRKAVKREAEETDSKKRFLKEID